MLNLWRNKPGCTTVILAVCVATLAQASATSAAPGEAVRIALVSGRQATYHQAVDAARSALEASGYTCIAFELPEPEGKAAVLELAEQLRAAEAHIIAGSGVEATLFALQAVPSIPVVALMIPNVLDAPFVDPDYPERDRVAAVAADADPEKLLDWMIELTPQSDHLGLLYSPRTRRTADALRQAADRAGVKMTTIAAARDRFPDAIAALSQSDCAAVLMIPDAAVYNAPNVQRLLLWGLRQERAVWGFSESIVRAGALAGQFPDAESVAERTQYLIERVLAGEKPGELPVAYVTRPQRAVNLRTADMIHLELHERAIDHQTLRLGDE